MNWNELKHFSRRENWGKPDHMYPPFLLTLDAYRDDLGVPLYVSKGVGSIGSHDVENSAHYIDPNTGYAYAVDVFPLLSTASKISLFDCFLLATKYPFTGIGIYPHWRLSRVSGKGKIIERGGLHLDMMDHRELKKFQCSGHWIGVPGKGYKQIYLGVSKWNLKLSGLL